MRRYIVPITEIRDVIAFRSRRLMKKTKTVQVLFFDGCPNVDLATRNASEAIANAGVSATIRLVRIAGEAEAVRRRFLGSPTVRVDGVDVELSAGARSDFGLQCRVYSVDGRLTAAPPTAWIEAALRADPSLRTRV